MLEQSKRSNDGFYYESTRNKVIINGIICKLHKFRRLATMSGPKIEYFAGKNKIQKYERDEDLFYRTSGSNLSLCVYYYNLKRGILSTAYNRNLSYRFLRRFYPEELL